MPWSGARGGGRPPRAVTRAAVAGAAAGVIVFVLTIRLNPEVHPTVLDLLGGAVLWASWGMVWAGLPVLGLGALLWRLRRRRWSHPALLGLVYFLAAALYSVNADLHFEFLPSSVTHLIRLDAVLWLTASAVAAGAAAWLRPRAGARLPRVAVVAVLLVLPLVRVATAPTPPRFPDVVEARSLGQPARPLLVIGMEGLDAGTLLAHAGEERLPAFARLDADGAWGALDAYRPYLRRSLWTSLATGAYPRKHGVESRWGWRFPMLFAEPFRLLPSPQQAFQWTLPWGLASKGDPPPTSLPPLWDRLAASGVEARVLDWPGIWRAGSVADEPMTPARLPLPEEFRVSLEAVLEPFPEHRDEILDAVRNDRARYSAALAALDGGGGNVWVYLESLTQVRRRLEPHRASDTRERQVVDVVLELLDAEMGALFSAADPHALVVVASPYGLDPPDSLERLLRLLGAARQWRATPRGCPDGAVVFLGDGVVPGRRFERALVIDVAPTMCYLLGLPVAQFMEGRVIVDVVDPVFLTDHPLRLVD